MARKYALCFENTTVSAAQDLVFIPGPAAGKMVFITRFWVGCGITVLPTGQGLRLRARVLPATVTAGANGTTGLTPVPIDPGDAACSVTTAAINNTTKATTSGTAVQVYANGVHLFQGEDRKCNVPVPPASAFVFELLSTVSGTLTLSGGVELEEVG